MAFVELQRKALIIDDDLNELFELFSCLKVETDLPKDLPNHCLSVRCEVQAVVTNPEHDLC